LETKVILLVKAERPCDRAETSFTFTPERELLEGRRLMPITRPLAATAIATSIAGAFIALTAYTPAFAGQGDVEKTCPSNNVCMWEDNNYGGNKWVEQTARLDRVYDIDWWDGDNEISSIKNTSGLYVCVYPGDYTWGGGYIVVEPHQELPNLAQSHGFDNQAESLKFVDEPVFDCN
jgi:hypothetical protein